MTIKTRNRITKSFLGISIAVILLVAGYIIAGIITNSLRTDATVRVPEFLNSLSFMPVSTIATFISIFVLFLSVPVMLFIIQTYFQTTQASEIIFYYGFLIACFAEGVRLITPLFDVANSFSLGFIFLSRLLFMGRILSPLCFLFCALMSSQKMVQDLARNFFLMIAIPCVFATVVPVNTAFISTTFEPTYGFAGTFNIARVTLIFVSWLTFYFESRNQNSPELKPLANFFVIMISGYLTLTSSDNYYLLFIGTGLYIWGTYRYMKTLHKMYMWK